MTTSDSERKKLLSQEDSRKSDFVKPFCSRTGMVTRSVNYCCLECTLEEGTSAEDKDEEDTLAASVSTAISVQRKELRHRIRRVISFTRRLQKRYARRMGRSTRPSDILGDRRRFWEIVFPRLPWKKHLQLNGTNETMEYNETMVSSDSGLRVLLSVLQVLKQAEFQRECYLTARGFYHDLKHLEGNADRDGLFQIFCQFRALLPSSAFDDTPSTTCTTSCREDTNATLSRIFQSVSLTKTLDLALITRVFLLDTIKFLFFVRRLVRIV